MTFLGIVACQIGTAFAARTQRAPLRSIGMFSNPLLLWGIAFEIIFAGLVVLLPAAQRIFGTAMPPAAELVLLLPMPALVWAADELWRAWQRTKAVPKTPTTAAKRPIDEPGG